MINKQADLIDLFWDHGVGPAENILGLLESGYMFFGGTWGRVAALIAAAMGLSLSGLGRFIDSTLGLSNLQDLANVPDNVHEEVSGFENELSATSSMAKYRIVIAAPKNQSDILALLGLNKPKKSSNSTLIMKLKEMARNLMSGGILAFLTLKGINAYKKHKAAIPSSDVGQLDTNKTIEDEISASKSHLEEAIVSALAE